MKQETELQVKLIDHPNGKVSTHVIFIHGLGGDLFDTWQSHTKPSEFWPSWLFDDIEIK